MPEPVEKPPRGKRWSAVSASASAKGDYRIAWKNPEKWYSFMTIYPPAGLDKQGSDDDEDGGDSDEGEGIDDNDNASESSEDREGIDCGKKGCMCGKQPALHPDHPWVVSKADGRKFCNQHIHADLREPENFGMYAYNDYPAYGLIEVLENLFLDFEEAAGRGWREQWAVCEGTALWLIHPASRRMALVDDSVRCDETYRMAGCMFLHMLARLDDWGLLSDNSEVKSLGCIMALYIQLTQNIVEIELRPDDELKRTKARLPLDHFDDVIMSYAKQRGVTLKGPNDIEDLTAELKADIELPKKGASDPWQWEAKLRNFEKRNGDPPTRGCKAVCIGGDHMDVTTWTSAGRKANSFDGKDPFSKRDLKAIKEGQVLEIR